MPMPRCSCYNHSITFVVGEWLSLVEHLVPDQGVGGSNPLSPTNISLALSLFSHFAAIDFPPLFGTTRGNSKPIACSRTRTHVRFAEKVNGGTGRYTVILNFLAGKAMNSAQNLQILA